jgi:hypothetical protein
MMLERSSAILESKQAFKVPKGLESDGEYEKLGCGITVDLFYSPEEIAELRAHELTDDQIPDLTPEREREILSKSDSKAAPTTDVTALRLQLRRNGFHPIPVEDKGPRMRGWPQKIDVSEEEIRRWEKTYPRARRTGVIAKPTPGFDIDITIEAAAQAAEDKAREFLEEQEHGNIYVRVGNPPKRLIPLRTDEPFKKLWREFKAPDGSKQRLELLCDGQQYVVDGTHPKTGEPYTWLGGELTAIKRENLPDIRRESAEQILDAQAKVLIEEHGFELTGTSKAADNNKRLDFTQESTSDNGDEDLSNFKVAPGLESEGKYERLGEGLETYSWWDRLPPNTKTQRSTTAGAYCEKQQPAQIRQQRELVPNSDNSHALWCTAPR